MYVCALSYTCFERAWLRWELQLAAPPTAIPQTSPLTFAALSRSFVGELPWREDRGPSLEFAAQTVFQSTATSPTNLHPGRGSGLGLGRCQGQGLGRAARAKQVSRRLRACGPPSPSPSSPPWNTEGSYCWGKGSTTVRSSAKAPKSHANMDSACIGSSLLALILYWNTLDADFAYDDSRAIKTNQDLVSGAPLSNVFHNDFWGTPLTHSGSHKSYRPLCVLSFRLNHYLGGLDPFGYHLGNVILHAAVTLLFTRTARVFLRHSLPVWVAGLVFAAHPVHTEAVAGVVGRADVGACLFFLLALLSYVRYCEHRDLAGLARYYTRRWVYLAGALVAATCSMLTKEHGITVLLVCAAYDAFVHCRVRIADVPNLLFEKRHRGILEGVGSIVAALGLLITLRLHLMGSKAPDFAPADNPAADHESMLTRALTFLYLPAYNFWLLLCPRWLSFDWSMEAIPLVTSPFDPRNAVSLLFYATIIRIGCCALDIGGCRPRPRPRPRTLTTPPRESSQLLAPPMGSPMDLCSSSSSSTSSVSSSSSTSSSSSISSNGHSNGSLSQSCYWTLSAVGSGGGALSVFCPSAAGNLQQQKKKNSSATNGSGGRPSNGYHNHRNNHHHNNHHHHHHNNYKNQRHQVGRVGGGDSKRRRAPSNPYADALAVALATLILPFLPATNLFFYVGFVVAERVLYIPSMGFCLLVAVGVHVVSRKSAARRRWCVVALVLLVLIFSVRTVRRNRDWNTEENLYRSGIPVNPPKAFGNLANILSSQGKKEEAEWAYKKALGYRSNMADVHYNLGILLQEQKRHEEALQSYRLAIQFRPRMAMAHLNLGLVLAILGRKEEAIEVYRHCSQLDGTGLKDPKTHESTKISALFNLGRLFADDAKYEEAIEVYKEAVRKMPAHYQPQSLYNMLGESYFKLERFQDAELWYKEALRVKPDHIPAHLTYGKMLAKLQNRVNEAEQWFTRAKLLAPNDSSVYQHYGQFLSETERHTEAAAHYMRAAELAPDEYEIIFNAANTLRQAGRNDDAEKYYRLAVKLRPNEATSHMNLGAMLHVNGKLKEAEMSYLSALRLKPDDAITQNNLQKLRNLVARKVQQGKGQQVQEGVVRATSAR